MACQPAPVAKAFSDQALALEGTWYLGICGDQAHNGRCSGHNAAPLCTDRGNFPRGYAHASDTGVPDQATGDHLVERATRGPGQHTVLYAIYRGVGYYPAWRGGGTFGASGHEGHVHVSHVAGSTFLRPDFGIGQHGHSSTWAAIKAALANLLSFLSRQPSTNGPEVLDMILAKRVGGADYWWLSAGPDGMTRCRVPDGDPADYRPLARRTHEDAGGRVIDITAGLLGQYRDVTAEHRRLLAESKRPA